LLEFFFAKKLQKVKIINSDSIDLFAAQGFRERGLEQNDRPIQLSQQISQVFFNISLSRRTGCGKAGFFPLSKIDFIVIGSEQLHVSFFFFFLFSISFQERIRGEVN